MAPKREQRQAYTRASAHGPLCAGLRVLQRIVDGEAFGPRRHQQRIIGGDKQGWRHPRWCSRRCTARAQASCTAS